MPRSAGSDSETKKHEGSRGIERTKPWHSADDVPWTMLSEPQLADAYRAVVEPALRREGRDPESDRPSYEWLSSNGFRAVTYALKKYHDTTFATFWSETLEYREEGGGYDWGVHDSETRESMERYLSVKQADREDWSDSTRETVRYRLARYAQSYRAKHGTDDLLTPVDAESDITETEAIDRCRDTFREMAAEGLAQTTIARVHDAIRGWYSWLDDRAVATVNPTNGAEDHFRWSRSHEDDPVALDAEHVATLYDAALTGRQRMMTIALCAWGLRAGEVAALHTDQLHLDADEPYVEFEDRKNGPGTVAIVYGADVAATYATRREGYLFPSSRSKTGHVWPSTVADWFHDIADRAGIPEEIDGQPRKPHMGRRFWYEAYSETLDDVLEFLEDIAEDQGSASPKVVMEDYLGKERAREQRREFMRDRLAAAFGGDDDGV